MMFIWSAKQRKFTNISRSINDLILIRSIRAESTSKTYIKTCNHQKFTKKIPKTKQNEWLPLILLIDIEI